LVRYELLLLAELGFGLDEVEHRSFPGTIRDGLRLTGDRLARDVLTDRQAEVLPARERLVERLKRMGS
jgi:DNA repair protein RecO (recombination protein O)